jgi:hypothetical protein
MTPGPNEILRLPDSSTLVKVRTIASGNTFGARRWTDGKLDAPMLPVRWPILRQPETGEVFWRDDCELVAKEDWWVESSENLSKVAFAEDPTLEDFVFLLERRPPATEDRERTLRIFTWWAWNDGLRDGKIGPLPDVIEEFRHNLQRLDLLLKPETDSARLMLAEIARELGNHKLSMERLEHAFPQDLTRCVAIIKAANERSDPRVLEVT